MNPDKKNDFDRQLAGKFKDFRPEPPSGLWDKIASKLDEPAAIAPIEQRPRFPAQWWISVAASVLLVCGITYWYNRPVAVTYLQSPAAQVEKTEPPVVEKPTAEPTTEVEPLDVNRLTRLFAKRNRKANPHQQERMVIQEVPVDRPADAADNQPAITEESTSPAPKLAENGDQAIPPSTGHPSIEEAVAASVPDIQPPVVLNDEEETRLAAAEGSKQPFGVSNILNYVVGAVDQREEKLITFSNDSEGSIKLDFNFGLARNKKKNMK